MGEYFRDNKQHALIIYDDLSKHAVAYRQIVTAAAPATGPRGLSWRRLLFALSLLERAAKLNDALGGGSLTALRLLKRRPVISAPIFQLMLFRVTDGQIFMETNLFYQGIRPAISVGLSVSRVGGSAQTKAIKSVAGTLRLDLAHSVN